MRAPRSIAVSACVVGVAGGVPATFRDVAYAFGEQTSISQDASAGRGTAIPPEARAAFVMLDSQSRVEPGPTRYRYYGGAAV